MALPCSGPCSVTRQGAGARCLLTPGLPSVRLNRPATSSAFHTAPGASSFLAHRRAASQRVHYQEDDKQPQSKHIEQEAWDRIEARAADAEAAPIVEAASTSTSTSAAATTEGYNYSPEFVRRRLMLFVGLVVGYTTFYLTRGSLTYSAPMLVADPALGLNLSAIGTMTSIFPMAYGVSKFVAGVMGAQFSARLMLGLGLMATASVNIAFGFSSSLTAFCLLWGLNGMLQGVGAPTCATILTRWFASKERGTYWGMWNIAHNLGGFLAPVIVGMWVPGAIGISVSLLVLGVVRDRPQDCGFPPVDNGMPAAPKKAAATASSSGSESKSSMLDVMRDVLKMPQIWALAFTYFFIYVVRQGVTSWLVFYLMAEKGATDAAQAALTVSGLELGGLAGSVVAGALSDASIRNASPTTGHVGKRVQVIMAYTAAMAGMLLALKAVPAGASVLQWIAIAGLGFTIYGPQMLIGLTGAELVSPSAVGASQGILGWIAYLGAANAGIPLSHIVQTAGWNGFFTALLGACGVALLLLSTVSRASSYNQRTARQAALA